jgi:hypothetical protein
MQPVEFDGSRTIGKPENMTDDQCFAIPAYSGIDENGYPFWLTAWKPSYEDLEALKRGDPLWIKSICKGLVPMSVFTMDEKGKCNDAG